MVAEERVQRKRHSKRKLVYRIDRRCRQMQTVHAKIRGMCLNLAPTPCYMLQKKKNSSHGNMENVEKKSQGTTMYMYKISNRKRSDTLDRDADPSLGNGTIILIIVNIVWRQSAWVHLPRRQPYPGPGGNIVT